MGSRRRPVGAVRIGAGDRIGGNSNGARALRLYYLRDYRHDNRHGTLSECDLRTIIARSLRLGGDVLPKPSGGLGGEIAAFFQSLLAFLARVF